MQNFGDGAADIAGYRASRQDGSYPRPQLVRATWVDLAGAWGFRYDDEDRGLGQKWYAQPDFERTIVVPFPPESPASGIGDPGFHRVVWYSRELTTDEVARAPLERVILHFGAVDYRCRVWLNGQLLGDHEGGHTPFSFDITDQIDPENATQLLVVRAEDDPLDVSQPRGKQDWMPSPHEVWYDRTTGIWQTVWIETAPVTHIAALHWVADGLSPTARASIQLAGIPAAPAAVDVTISFDGTVVGAASVSTTTAVAELVIPIAALRNGQGFGAMLWSPDQPALFDARVEVTVDDQTDVVESYFGARSVAAAGGLFVLNERPLHIRSVLSQGFWPESHLAAPAVDSYRSEAQLIADLGFNAVRVHQKIEDPRFLYWTDRIGILVWEEMPSAFEFSPAAVIRVNREWSEAVQRDRSHPSIVTWVPLNESWGVQQIASDPAMLSHAVALAALTKALDPTRPVISNDGWEHAESDIWTIHDYEESAAVMDARYANDSARLALFEGFGPAGRRIRLTTTPDLGQPVMLTEFGGIRFTPGNDSEKVWGYSSALSADDFRDRLTGLMGAVKASGFLAGYCYTQLTDTQQEANGLVDERRSPKLPLEDYRAIFGN